MKKRGKLGSIIYIAICFAFFYIPIIVTWLYKLTVNSRDYSYAATIGILVFIICSLLSLITFRRSASYKNEEAFQ